MQQTFGFKQFVVNHVAATALAASVLVSGALGVAALGVTGNLPWTVDGNGPSVAAQVQRAAQVAQTSAQKDARLAQAQRFWEHKEQQLDALSPGEAQAATQAARVAQAQRFWEHKEQQLDALSPGEAELIVPNANHLNEPFQP